MSSGVTSDLIILFVNILFVNTLSSSRKALQQKPQQILQTSKNKNFRTSNVSQVK